MYNMEEKNLKKDLALALLSWALLSRASIILTRFAMLLAFLRVSFARSMTHVFSRRLYGA